MKRMLISEEEKKRILEKHAHAGLTLSEKISDLEQGEFEMDDFTEEEERYDTHEMDNDMDTESDFMESYDELGEMYDMDDMRDIEEMDDMDDMDDMDYMRDIEEMDDMDDMENPKYEKSLDNEPIYELEINDDEPIYEIEIDEDDADAPFEEGPRGMRAARTRADFDPTSREIEMTGVFGKHGEDVPPTTIRYMRKNPGTIIKRMADMYGVDKIKNWLGED